MNRFMLRTLIAILAVMLVCTSFVGCNKNPDPTTDNDTTATTTTAPRPTQVLTDATGSVFLGTWNVTAKKSPITSLTFFENGELRLFANNNQLAGTFLEEGDQISLSCSGLDLVGAFAIDGDTITINTADDVLTLTKQN